MGRNKVKLQLIENEISRKTTYTKRLRGVLRKTQELSVLCGVEVCVVIYGPYSQAPVVWPSSETEAKRIIKDFKRRPEMDQSQKQFDQEAFMNERLAKAKEKLSRLQRKNREMEMENLITDILTGRMKVEQVPTADLRDLLWVLEDKLSAIEQRQIAARCFPPVPPQHAVTPQDAVVPQDGGGGLDDAGSSTTDDDYGLSAVVRQYISISQTPTQTQTQTQTQIQAGSSQDQSGSSTTDDDYGLSAVVRQYISISQTPTQTQTQIQAGSSQNQSV